MGGRKNQFVRKEGHVYKHECDMCDYGTDVSGSLKIHKDAHEGVRYECPVTDCVKSYAQKPQCSKHIKNKHGGLGIPIRTIELLPGIRDMCVPIFMA